MKFKKWFESWDITGLKIKTPILEMDWSLQEADRVINNEISAWLFADETGLILRL